MPAPFLFVAVAILGRVRMMAGGDGRYRRNKKPGPLRIPAQKRVKQIGAKSSNLVCLLTELMNTSFQPRQSE
ncbi:Uncharacterised protein [Serratia entomophila]|jgi:hypothetical protein|nr:Uncharacterised protein [Serratia entomophila]CAI1016881.1 Uncharacterised protein [Serratia entomophila]CAI1028439.1 Uncharacterised protein [Serratia entomophila]CAI1165443.1 Uncharacterised protein [Serratia entomophila]CAI1169568.1 Uncharacterised protein [Serratia entomophila]